MVTKKEFESANMRGRRLASATPKPLSVKYNRKSGRIVLELERGVGFFFSPDAVEGFEGATPAQLSAIEVTPSGLGIHFPKLNADIYLPALLEGTLGSRKWMASRMGSVGGSSRSTAKSLAARENGKRGGRPRNSSARKKQAS